jgi:carboxylesterase
VLTASLSRLVRRSFAPSPLAPSPLAPSPLATALCALTLVASCATNTPTSNPTPTVNYTSEYATAVASVERRQLQDDAAAAAGARSVLLTHGHPTPRAFVLLHGFSDSPSQFRAVGEHLFAGGDNVYIPRLPHHADRVRRVRELGRVRAKELALFGDSTIDIARSLGDTVIVVGLSAGGAIGAHLVQTRREVYRAVLLAPAIGAGGVSDDDERNLLVLASVLPDIRRSEPADSTRPDYIQGITTRGLAQVLQLGHEVRDQAGSSAARGSNMVFVLNERDHTVNEDAALDLARRWAIHGASVSAFRFPGSANLPHNIMEIPQRGGNPDVVLPVVEALALARTPPETVHSVDIPCDGFDCVRQWWRKRGR